MNLHPWSRCHTKGRQCFYVEDLLEDVVQSHLVADGLKDARDFKPASLRSEGVALPTAPNRLEDILGPVLEVVEPVQILLELIVEVRVVVEVLRHLAAEVHETVFQSCL